MLGGEQDNYWISIDHFLCDIEHRPFTALVSRLHPQRILEIGVAKGWGAERMIKAAGGREHDIEYYGIDLFRKCTANKFTSTPMNQIYKKLEKLDAEIFLFAGDSHEVLHAMISALPKMDLIYIDGDHTKKGAERDWKGVWPFMHPDTVVVFDDYVGVGVREVVNTIKGYRVELMKSVRYFLFHRRVESIKAVVSRRNMNLL